MGLTTHLLILSCSEDLTDALLPKKVILKLVGISPTACSGCRIHPFQFLLSLLPRLLFLQSLQFLVDALCDSKCGKAAP